MLNFTKNGIVFIIFILLIISLNGVAAVRNEKIKADFWRLDDNQMDIEKDKKAISVISKVKILPVVEKVYITSDNNEDVGYFEMFANTKEWGYDGKGEAWEVDEFPNGIFKIIERNGKDCILANPAKLVKAGVIKNEYEFDAICHPRQYKIINNTKVQINKLIKLDDYTIMNNFTLPYDPVFEIIRVNLSTGYFNYTIYNSTDDTIHLNYSFLPINGTYTTQIYSTNRTNMTPNLKLNITSGASCNNLNCPKVKIRELAINVSDKSLIYAGLLSPYDNAKDYKEKGTKLTFTFKNPDNVYVYGEQGISTDGKGNSKDKIYTIDSSDTNLMNSIRNTDEITIFADIDMKAYSATTHFLLRMSSTVSFDFDSNDIRLYLWGPGTCISAPTSDMSLNQRHKIIVTKNNQTGEGLFYVDGVLVENDSCTGHTTATGTLLSLMSDNSVSPFNGTVYSILIWNRSFSDTEAKYWTGGNYANFSAYSTTQQTTDGTSTLVFNLSNTTNYIQAKYDIFGDSVNSNVINSINLTIYNTSVSGTTTTTTTTTTSSTTTTTTAGGSICTWSSGNMNCECGKHKTIEANYDIYPANLSFNGTGDPIAINSSIHVLNIFVESGCGFYPTNTGVIRWG